MEMDQELLTSIQCVLRAKSPRIVELRHVLHYVHTLLDVSSLLSLSTAAKKGSVRLFDRVYRRMLAVEPIMDANLFEFNVGEAMKAAVTRGCSDIVRHIHSLHPHRLPVRLLPLAAASGDLEMLRWLLSHRTDDLCCPRPIDFDADTNELQSCCVQDAYLDAVRNQQLHIVRWLYETGFYAVLVLKRAGDWHPR